MAKASPSLPIPARNCRKFLAISSNPAARLLNLRPSVFPLRISLWKSWARIAAYEFGLGYRLHHISRSGSKKNPLDSPRRGYRLSPRIWRGPLLPDGRFPLEQYAAIFALPNLERHADGGPVHCRPAGSGHDHPHFRGHPFRRDRLGHHSSHRYQARCALARPDGQMVGVGGHARNLCCRDVWRHSRGGLLDRRSDARKSASRRNPRLYGMPGRPDGHFPNGYLVLYPHERSNRARSARAGLSRRVAGANERIRSRIGARVAWRGFKPDYAHRSRLAPGSLFDAAAFGGRFAVYAICRHFRSQRRDGRICRFLHAAYACVSHLPFSAARSVERLSQFLVLLPPAEPSLDSMSPQNLADRDVQKA